MIEAIKCHLPAGCSILSSVMPKTLSGRIFAVASAAIAIGVVVFVCRKSFYNIVPFITNPEKDCFINDLEAWAAKEKANNPDAQTKTAVKRIKECQEKSGCALYLRELNLKSLPKIIGSLQSLKYLYLSSNKLSILPGSMGSLQSLTSLDLRFNNLSILPESMGTLQSLERLGLAHNQLSILPKSMGNLQSLESLDLGHNQLSILPESMGNLQSLKYLYLSNNKLDILLDWIGNLESLETLILAHNNLSILPESMGSLQSLQRLNLDSNPLTSLPNSILSLPSDCVVWIRALRLTERTIQQLREEVNRSGYNGPRFHFDMTAHNTARPEKSLEDLCQDLTQLTGQSLPENFVKTHKDNNDLTLFLNKIGNTYEFEKGSAEMKKALAQKLVAYLALMHVNEDYAEAFQSIIEGEANKCGDRIALAIIRLGIAKQLIEYDLHDLAKLADFLKRGVWTVGSCVPDQYVMGLLENIAAEKIEILRFVDDVEVYLAYFVKLKELLNLPLDISEMVHYGISGVTKEDLSIAESQVRADWNNKDKFYAFLITQPKWEEALKARYSNDMEQLDEQRYKALENALAAETIWREGLLKLTKKALG
ncbi:MAG: hypothetical protein H7A40_06960 [Chlamydiales bacterium]|nr:hypothetical protein [Chlamydiales bacterium]